MSKKPYRCPECGEPLDPEERAAQYCSVCGWDDRDDKPLNFDEEEN